MCINGRTWNSSTGPYKLTDMTLKLTNWPFSFQFVCTSQGKGGGEEKGEGRAFNLLNCLNWIFIINKVFAENEIKREYLIWSSQSLYFLGILFQTIINSVDHMHRKGQHTELTITQHILHDGKNTLYNGTNSIYKSLKLIQNNQS